MQDELRFDGDGTAVGYTAGVLWLAHPKIALGATYRSISTVDYDGNTKVRFPGLPPQSSGRRCPMAVPPEHRCRGS